MQTVGASWTLVQAGEPTLVAALLAAGSAPLFLAGLPAGVLAEIVDRRKLLIVANVVVTIAAAAMAALPFLKRHRRGSFWRQPSLSVWGAAFSARAFQAIVCELANGDELAPSGGAQQHRRQHCPNNRTGSRRRWQRLERLPLLLSTRFPPWPSSGRR
ncbi:hypothetical protein HLI17_28505 [Rhizobium laguerreae]|uniref:MFS transporter n=1 Tax=Rhizobium laguerreae TaxID=1076926 RepID=A0A7Y2RA24_9HYPH|nr:hypothetical protein [Rhizobium laguerreae]